MIYKEPVVRCEHVSLTNRRSAVLEPMSPRSVSKISIYMERFKNLVQEQHCHRNHWWCTHIANTRLDLKMDGPYVIRKIYHAATIFIFHITFCGFSLRPLTFHTRKTFLWNPPPNQKTCLLMWIVHAVSIFSAHTVLLVNIQHLLKKKTSEFFKSGIWPTETPLNAAHVRLLVGRGSRRQKCSACLFLLLVSWE